MTSDTNLAVRISSDPNLIQKIFPKLKDPKFSIPSEYEEELRSFSGIKSTEKGILISKVTTPNDYQTQLSLLSYVQHCLDRCHEINTDLYIIQARFTELLVIATRIITLNYFSDLNELKESMRKLVMAVALQPIQEGIDKLQVLIGIGESTHKHLTATNFNIKEGTEIITEYLALLKYPNTVRTEV